MSFKLYANNSTLNQEYQSIVIHSLFPQQFQGTDEIEYIKLFDETRVIAKSMQAAISLIKNESDSSHLETLKTLYASKLSLSYHKNFTVIKRTFKFLQNINRYIFSVDY